MGSKTTDQIEHYSSKTHWSPWFTYKPTINGCWVAARIVRSSLICLTWFNWIKSRIAMIFKAWYSSLSSVNRRVRITRLNVPTPDRETDEIPPVTFGKQWSNSFTDRGDEFFHRLILPNASRYCRQREAENNTIYPYVEWEIQSLSVYLSLLSVWLFLFHIIL